MVVGDFNADDKEIDALSKTLALREARYAGLPWNAAGNRFYVDRRRDPGKRKDRVLFSEQVWAEAHLVGQGKVFFEGKVQFVRSFGCPLLC